MEKERYKGCKNLEYLYILSYNIYKSGQDWFNLRSDLFTKNWGQFWQAFWMKRISQVFLTKKLKFASLCSIPDRDI